LDEKWTQQLGKSEHDSNAYSLGVIAGHNVVLVHMPSLGKVSAASVAAGVNSSFTCVKYAFVVGICGGVPFNGKQEVILGDVIISKVLVQYDLGKQYPDAFEAKSTIEESLTRPSQEIRSVLAKLATSQHQQRMQQEITTHIHAIQKELPGTVYPGSGSDHLYDASYLHKHRTIEGKAPCIVCESGPEHICPDASMMKCEDLGCEDSKLLQRTRLSKDNGSDINSSYGSPQLRIGRMGSADTVLKSGTHRERIASANGLIAFETEGAGMWDDFRHSLVIKGVCDYADSHKNKQWQFFAAAAAAACMKSFLGEIRLSEDTWEYGESMPPL
jgi:nucleoside phosphorylase